MVFAEDFLEKKEAEAQAQAAAEQSQIEHNRQKELLDAQARTAEAQALTAQATAQAQPPALDGNAQATGSTLIKDILEVVVPVLVLGGLGVGGWYIYDKYWGESSVKIISSEVDSDTNLNSLEDKMVGEWKGTSGNVSASFIFNKDKSALMVVGNTVVDGTTINGSVTWNLNPNSDPMHLDIDAVKPDKKVKLPFIVRFIGDNKLQIGLASKIDGEYSSRPINFSVVDEENLVILDRQ